MFCFVVLHYKNIDDTLECIQNIKKINGKKEIIVVDNNSCSTSEKELLSKEKVDLKFLNKNYGFAKANNIGINYAKEKYKPKFVIVINNDVFIKQNDFLEKVSESYKEYKFDMIGPFIESPSGESINPFPVIKTKQELKYEINYSKKLIKIYNISLLYYLLQLYLKIKKIIVKKETRVNGSKLQKKVALHGCAIIFSEKYLKKYDKAFFDETFLYHEEEFLFQRVINDNLISVYNPKLKVFHKEGSATKTIMKGNRKKSLFRERERIKSLKLLEKYWGKQI